MNESLNSLKKVYVDFASFIFEFSYKDILEKDLFFLESYFGDCKTIDEKEEKSENDLSKMYDLIIKIKMLLIPYLESAKVAKKGEFVITKEGNDFINKALGIKKEPVDLNNLLAQTQTFTIFGAYLQENFIKNYNKIFKEEPNFLEVLKKEFMFWFNLVSNLIISIKFNSHKILKKSQPS